jgi:hypothetical protein
MTAFKSCSPLSAFWRGQVTLLYHFRSFSSTFPWPTTASYLSLIFRLHLCHSYDRCWGMRKNWAWFLAAVISQLDWIFSIFLIFFLVAISSWHPGTSRKYVCLPDGYNHVQHLHFHPRSFTPAISLPGQILPLHWTTKQHWVLAEMLAFPWSLLITGHNGVTFISTL